MPIQLQRTLFILAAVGGLLMSGFANADQIHMKNGDVITGNVTKIEDGDLYIEPSYADEFAVDLSEVVLVEADRVYEIELKDGEMVDAQFATGADGQQALVIDGNPQSVTLTDLAAASEPEEWYDRTSHVDVNMTWNSGNTDSRNNLIFADTRLKLGDHRHLGEITFRRDETDGTSTKKQDLLKYSYNWLFNDPWFVGATASYERDPIKLLDHRYTVGATVGRDIFNDSRKFLSASLGFGYSEEKTDGLADSGATGLWNLIYEHDFVNGDLTFFHNQNLNYQFYGVNNAIFKTNTGFRFDIISDVYTNISLRWDYESDPANDAKNNDTTVVIGVGAKF